MSNPFSTAPSPSSGFQQQNAPGLRFAQQQQQQQQQGTGFSQPAAMPSSGFAQQNSAFGNTGFGQPQQQQHNGMPAQLNNNNNSGFNAWASAAPPSTTAPQPAAPSNAWGQQWQTQPSTGPSYRPVPTPSPSSNFGTAPASSQANDTTSMGIVFQNPAAANPAAAWNQPAGANAASWSTSSGVCLLYNHA
jgi:hypothetical protein